MLREWYCHLMLPEMWNITVISKAILETSIKIGNVHNIHSTETDIFLSAKTQQFGPRNVHHRHKMKVVQRENT